MKYLASTLLVVLCLTGATPSSAVVPNCRPVALPMPGAPQGVIVPFKVFVGEVGNSVAPIPVLVFSGDVVLIEGDQALADQQTCLYYQQGIINPATWSDVLHIDNNNPAVPSQAISSSRKG